MNEKISRRRFIQSGSVVYAISALSGIVPVGATAEIIAQTTQTNRIPDRGPRLSSEMVNEFVIAGHANLDKVKKLLAQEPKLVNAAWDGAAEGKTA